MTELDLVAESASDLGADPARAATVARIEVAVGSHCVSGLHWGRGDPEVVFLHGGGQNAHTWDALLLQTDFPAVAFDLPGHGRSSWRTDGLYLPRDIAPTLAAAVEAVAPNARGVVGMSLGGLAGLVLGATRPDITRRLVVVDVSPASTPERSRQITSFAALGPFPSFDDMVSHAERYRPSAPRRALRRAVYYNAQRRPDGQWEWRHDRRDVAGGDRMAPVFADLPSYWETVAEVACPTLLVVGGRSPIVTPADVERYRALLPGIEVVEIEGARHSVQGDRPRELAQLLQGFLELGER